MDAIKSIKSARPIPLLTAKEQANFWSKVNKNGSIIPGMDSPCWEWIAGKFSSGYGAFAINRQAYGAHRISYALAFGQLPKDQQDVLHKCDNPSCLNPSHLFSGDDYTNQADMIKKGRGNKSRGDEHYSRKRPDLLSRGDSHYSKTVGRMLRGESNGRAVLVADQVRNIRSSAKKGESVTSLSLRFGVSAGTVSGIVRGITWRHLLEL